MNFSAAAIREVGPVVNVGHGVMGGGGLGLLVMIVGTDKGRLIYDITEGVKIRVGTVIVD